MSLFWGFGVLGKVNEETEINDEESLSVEMDINIPPSSSEETKNL